MSTRKTIFAEGEYYHIFNRGVDKRNIFLRESDYNRFIKLLYLANSVENIHLSTLKRKDCFKEIKTEPIVSIAAWCLMKNHFHILLKEEIPGGVTKFMSKLQTAYSMYFNKCYKRSGALFQGMFQSRHADTDGYLKCLYAYIHLNAMKIFDPEWRTNGVLDLERTENFLKNYSYSSYFDYTDGNPRKENVILKKDAFPDYFAEKGSFKSMHDFWLKYKANLE